MANLRIISADSHVVEPADLWETRLDRKYRDQAPRVVRTETGRWVISAPGGISFPAAAMFAAGKRGEELRQHMGKGYEASRPSGWDPSERIKDQDIDGVQAEVLYTSNGMPLFGLDDADLQIACFRVFNDWLAEYCASNPGRLLGIALISLRDVSSGVAQLERCVKQGLRGAMISNSPHEPYDSPVYFPFWQAASDLGVPISLHIITTSRKQNEAVFNTSEIITLQMQYVFETQCSLARMLMCGVLERFPKLKLVSTENDIGWIPYFLQRLDHNYEMGAGGRTLPPMKPSDYARRQLWATFQDDACGVALYKFFGEDSFMWASDFPHSDSTWPNSRSVIERNFASIPETVLQKILGDNVSRLYGIAIH
jgi:predicted TIM-barrel fold metal-dependent hydrolase